jgi:hypothetical protein
MPRASKCHSCKNTCDITALLCKIHVHCCRDNTIVPPISPVTPIIGRPSLDIINHALKKMHFPPRCNFLRRLRIPVRSIDQTTGKSLPRILWFVRRTRIVQAGYLIERGFSTRGRVLITKSRHSGCGLYSGLSKEEKMAWRKTVAKNHSEYSCKHW